MPAELLTIPDIVVGSVVSGDLVLRNVVVSTDSQLPSNNRQQGELNQFVSDLKVPTDLPSDAVVVLIDSKTNSIIKASPAESEDFIAGGAYFIGAFDRATADAVVADMINNPIPSNEYLAGEFFNSAVKLGVTSYVVGVEIFRAMQNAKESWKGFVTLEDRVMNPPAPVLLKPATSRFPLKVTITAYQLDPNLSPESMEEVSGEIVTLFPNMDSRGFSIVSSNDREFTMVGTVASASELQKIFARMNEVNEQLAIEFPSGIITVIPDTPPVEPPVAYMGDAPVFNPCATTRCIKVYKPCLEGYIDADPCCPNTGNCIPDPNYGNVNAPVGELAQQYLDLNQAIADLESSGDEGLLELVEIDDDVMLYEYTEKNFSDGRSMGEWMLVGKKSDFEIKYQGKEISSRDGQIYNIVITSNDKKYYDLSETKAGFAPSPKNPIYAPVRGEMNSRYQQLVQARDELGVRLGVPSGCQPTAPHILPPSQVPAGCVPIIKFPLIILPLPDPIVDTELQSYDDTDES